MDRFLEQPVRTPRRPLGRSIVLLLLVVGAFALARTESESVRQRARDRWSYLCRRAGDTYTSLAYLALGAARPRAEVEMLETFALGQYRLSLEARPGDVRTVMSEALTLQGLERSKEAREVLRAALRRTRSPADRARLRALLTGVLTETPTVASVRAAEAAAGDAAPAALVLGHAYAAAGDAAAGQAVWDRALARARQLLPTLTLVVIVCGAILLAGLVGVGLGLVWLTTRPRRAALFGGASPAAEWRGRDALEGLLVFVLLQVLARSLAAGLHVSPAPDFYLVLGGAVLSGPLAIAWVKLTARPSAVLGWRLDRPKRDALLGLAAGGALVPPALALSWAVSVLFDLPPQGQTLVPIFTAATDLPARLFLILSACAIIPAVEETLFRGLLYGALRRYLAPGVAAVISALIFAGGHLTPAGLLSLVLVGAVLAWLYERTGSLLASAVAHGVFNAFGVATLILIYR